VAAREVLGHYVNAGLTQVALVDRSHRALKFAAETVRREFPAVSVETRMPESIGLLLVSHVLPELDEAGLADLLKAVQQAQAVIFVEPGTKEVSRRLIDLREKLNGPFKPVAPCLHASKCGLLTPENERHWCHFFVPPPNMVFTDSDWVHFGRIMGIDLRSLPLSYLVMDRREPPPVAAGTVRVLGRPRLYKGHMLLQGCDAGGVEEKRLMKRTNPAFFRAVQKHRVSTVQRWETDGTDITRVEE
jgi:ribosomal protein RSM22 (predicted rRNA methylase)